MCRTNLNLLLVLSSVVESEQVLLPLGLDLGVAGESATGAYAATPVPHGRGVEPGHAARGLPESSGGPRGQVKQTSHWLGHSSQNAFTNTCDKSLGDVYTQSEVASKSDRDS